jgi:hypothetical protein
MALGLHLEMRAHSAVARSMQACVFEIGELESCTASEAPPSLGSVVVEPLQAAPTIANAASARGRMSMVVFLSKGAK